MPLPHPQAEGAPGLRRGALATAATAFSVATLAACGTGYSAQTLEVKPDNAATAVGHIKVQNVVVITQPDHTAKGPAVVSATLFNGGRSDQTLDAITLGDSRGTAQLKPATGSGPLTVPAGGHVVLGGRGNASAVLTDGSNAVRDGNVQQVTFTFSEAGAVRLDSYVVAAKSYFTEWGPSETPARPSASPSAGASPSGSGTPPGSPSGTPSGSRSGQADASGASSGAAAAESGDGVSNGRQ